MVWAILLGLFLWDDLPDVLSFVGILILMSAGLYTFSREQKLRRPAGLLSRAALARRGRMGRLNIIRWTSALTS
jgi:hypothetical protein